MRGLPPMLGILLCACSLPAGAESGIAGTVRDVRGSALGGAGVQVQSESTGVRWKTQSDEDGRYAVEGLPPGRYKVLVRLPGFRTVARTGLSIDSSPAARFDFEMELLGLHQVITVVSARDVMDPSTGDMLTLARDSPGASLPANGQDLRTSFDLMPGVLTTAASVSDAGQFTANGQRPNASSFRVDGVSANTGVGGSALPGSFPGASLPAMTAIGTAESLASPSTAESVELRTSSFAAEFGDRPGALTLVTTRSGSNQYHGEFNVRSRDHGWAARDWFANSRGISFPRQHYVHLGAVFGGPVLRDRTFFFASYETAGVKFNSLALTSVPSRATRLNAPAAIRPVVTSFPLPTGRDLGNGAAEGLLAITRTANVTTHSLRVDHSLGARGSLFARLVHAPSTSGFGFFDTNSGRLHWSSGTAGATIGGPGGVIHALRINYSRARLQTILGEGFGGLALLNLAGLTALCEGRPAAATVFGLSIPGLGQFVEGRLGNPGQDQWELLHDVSGSAGRHEYRAGGDILRQQAWRSSASALVLATAPSLSSLLDGGSVAVTSTRMAQEGDRIHMASLFAQDTFRWRPGFNVIYGLRWELTPPTSSDLSMPTVTGIWSGAAWQSVSAEAVHRMGPWHMRYGQVAPRLGVAYRLPRGVVLRSGAGLFYDTTLGASLSPINGAPFNSWQMSTGTTGSWASGPSEVGGSASQAGTAPDVDRFLHGALAPLRLPLSYQWRTSLEEGIAAGSVASLAYVGSAGRRLLGNQAYVDPQTGVLARFVRTTSNSSQYHALQMRYVGSFSSNAYVSAAYSWSHAIDTSSQDSSVFLIHPGYRLDEARASSSFDVRHAMTAAVSYRLPRSSAIWWLPNGLHSWTISGILRARTGFPVDIKNTEQGLGRGFDNVGRPDLISGAAVWIQDPSAAGGRMLNREAFRVPTANRQGTLGRNAIHGNGLMQLDSSVRRVLPLHERLSIEVVLSAFNVLNHPAFADPVPYLSSPFFGQSTSMQNLMLGAGGGTRGCRRCFRPAGRAPWSSRCGSGFEVVRSAVFTYSMSFASGPGGLRRCVPAFSRCRRIRCWPRQTRDGTDSR